MAMLSIYSVYCTGTEFKVDKLHINNIHSDNNTMTGQK